MPKQPMSDIEFKEIQDKIIHASYQIISEVGYDNITMRKIASALNMSATRIYNYFKNKDEIYLRVMILGYELIFEHISKHIGTETDSSNKIRKFLEGYINFYFEKPNFYNLLFIQTVPRTENYSGKANYVYALLKYESGTKFYNLLFNSIKEYLDDRHINQSEEWINNRTLLVISQMHGAICLHYNRLMHEVTNDSEKVVLSTINLIMKYIEL